MKTHINTNGTHHTRRHGSSQGPQLLVCRSYRYGSYSRKHLVYHTLRKTWKNNGPNNIQYFNLSWCVCSPSVGGSLELVVASLVLRASTRTGHQLPRLQLHKQNSRQPVHWHNSLVRVSPWKRWDNIHAVWIFSISFQVKFIRIFMPSLTILGERWSKCKVGRIDDDDQCLDKSNGTNVQIDRGFGYKIPVRHHMA